MTTKRTLFGARPASKPDASKAVDEFVSRHSDEAAVPTRSRPAKGEKGDLYTSRLTLDITPELHRRIKLAAINSNKTMVELLRETLERAFPG